jgi:Flp pilus assembly protein TadB
MTKDETSPQAVLERRANRADSTLEAMSWADTIIVFVLVFVVFLSLLNSAWLPVAGLTAVVFALIWVVGMRSKQRGDDARNELARLKLQQSATASEAAPVNLAPAA